MVPDHSDYVTVESLAVTYPGRAEPVLRGVDLTVERGRIRGLLGRNGAGTHVPSPFAAGLTSSTHTPK